MAVNKVTLNTANGEQVLIDLTNDTVTPATLAAGRIAHDASGRTIVGVMSGSGSGASFDVTDDGAGNVTISNAAVEDNDGALIITLIPRAIEYNGHVTVGG